MFLKQFHCWNAFHNLAARNKQAVYISVTTRPTIRDRFPINHEVAIRAPQLGDSEGGYHETEQFSCGTTADAIFVILHSVGATRLRRRLPQPHDDEHAGFNSNAEPADANAQEIGLWADRATLYQLFDPDGSDRIFFCRACGNIFAPIPVEKQRIQRGLASGTL